MRNSPRISDIRQWLIKKNPLGLFKSSTFTIHNIDPKPWSGHFNYLIKIGVKKLVFRFKGPEWGEPTKGILDEYKILKYVEKYKVAPRAYYLEKDFFGEPMMLEEYLEGELLTKFSKKEQLNLFPNVARFIAGLNKIPVKQSSPFREPMISYKKNVRAWRKRLNVILKNKNMRVWGQRVEAIMPKAEKMLQDFEKRLKRVLRESGPVFIFESAHIGHCMKVGGEFRFLNWEQVGYGDPSYTLAVFLASISRRPDFEKAKKQMIKEYLKINPIPEFEELVDQRLKEREISNLLWVLWAHTQRGDAGKIGKIVGLGERFKKVKSML